MDRFWQGTRVLVTGATGFIGSCIVRELLGRGASVTASCTSLHRTERLQPMLSDIRLVEADLCHPEQAARICERQQIVVSVAHLDGSLEFKRSRPAHLFARNMRITLNMLEAASGMQTEKFLLTSSAEVYPFDAPVPTREDQNIVETMDRPVDGYIWSKRMSEFATNLFAHEYKIPILIARPTNVYGPGDDFDPARGRVIPSFVRRALNDEAIVIWGNGRQVRSFLYVEDLARGMVDYAEKGSAGDVVNFSGEPVAISDLAQMVVNVCRSRSEVRCDESKPSGPSTRVLDGTAAERIFEFRPRISLAEGLRRTVQACDLTRMQAGAACAAAPVFGR